MRRRLGERRFRILHAHQESDGLNVCQVEWREEEARGVEHPAQVEQADRREGEAGGHREDRDRARAAGFSAHLTKPFSYEELMSTLERSERRAAAYLAYWENAPLSRTRKPIGKDMPLYRRARWGASVRMGG